MSALSTHQKIIAFEALGYPQQPQNGYEALQRSAETHADKTALQFIIDGNSFDKSLSWTYKQFIAQVNSAANLFNAYGRMIPTA